MEDLVLTGMVLGNSFPFLLLYFSTYMDMDGTSPYERCSVADQGEALDKTKIARGPISASDHVTAKRNSPFLQGHSSTFTPDFQTQANKNCGILQYQYAQNISYTIQKTIKKKRLNRICYFRFKPEIQENSLWKHYLCRACRILCSFSKANRYGQAAKAREAVRAAVCPAVHLTSAAYSGFLQAKCIRCMD